MRTLECSNLACQVTVNHMDPCNSPVVSTVSSTLITLASDKRRREILKPMLTWKTSWGFSVGYRENHKTFRVNLMVRPVVSTGGKFQKLLTFLLDSSHRFAQMNIPTEGPTFRWMAPNPPLKSHPPQRVELDDFLVRPLLTSSINANRSF